MATRQIFGLIRSRNAGLRTTACGSTGTGSRGIFNCANRIHGFNDGKRIRVLNTSSVMGKRSLESCYIRQTSSVSRGLVSLRRYDPMVTRSEFKNATYISIRQLSSKHDSAVAAAEDTASVLERAEQTASARTPRPSGRQLRIHFLWEAVPMFSFGFMEMSIMIYAGNAIDCTIGVWFGLSTLTAAAFGNMVSNLVGLTAGGTVERAAMHLGLPSPGLSEAQRALKVVSRAGFAGTLVGAMVGCALGMLHLLFIDTDKSAILKLQALTQDQELAFEVECSNKTRNDATAITVRGPDVDGILASMTAALSAAGYSVLELHAEHRMDEGQESLLPSSEGTYEDTFIVRPRGTPGQVPDDDLEELGHTILAACKDPLSSHSLKAQVQDLRDDNEALIERVLWLEGALEDRQIKVERRVRVEGSGDGGDGERSDERTQ